MAADTPQVNVRHTDDEDEGFSILEVAIAGAIFMLVSLGFLTMMFAAVKTYSSARDRTVSQQVAGQVFEQARQLSWDLLGVSGGNPPGTLLGTQTVTVGGLSMTVVTKVAYVDDPVPNGISTGANYKRVTVTVTSPVAGEPPYSAETLIAPPKQPSLNTGVIRVYAVEKFDSAAIPGASVQLKTGPSATRSDVTDVSGSVTFA